MVRETPLGRVAAVHENGTILVKSPGPLPVRLGGQGSGLRVGVDVADARREPVGRVSDFIGPTSAPYAVVTPARGARLHRLLGKDVYAIEGQPPRRGPPAGGRPPSGRPPRQGGDRRRR